MAKKKIEEDVKNYLKEVWKLLHDANRFAEGEKKFNRFLNDSPMKKYLKSHPTDVLIVEQIKKKIAAGPPAQQVEESNSEDKFTRTDGLSTVVPISTINKKVNDPAPKVEMPERQMMEQWQVNIGNYFIGEASEINKHKKRTPPEHIKNLFNNAPEVTQQKERPTRQIPNQRSEKYNALNRNDPYVRVCSLLDYQIKKCDELINKSQNENNRSNDLRDCKNKLNQIFSQVETLRQTNPKNEDQLKTLLNNSRPVMDKIKNIEMTMQAEQKNVQQVNPKPQR